MEHHFLSSTNGGKGDGGSSHLAQNLLQRVKVFKPGFRKDERFRRLGVEATGTKTQEGTGTQDEKTNMVNGNGITTVLLSFN